MSNESVEHSGVEAMIHPSLLPAGSVGEPAPPSFEAALHELEAIVSAMESGQAPLEEAMQSYERGSRLLQHCHGLLAAAEQRLQVLEDGALASLAIPAGDDT